MEPRVIRVIGARQYNLRNVNVDVPRDRLTVVTGLSGSGKSSLAFDTIYAEGQRRYVESLSVHARVFLEQVGKPDVERIEGLPPTLAIEQRATAASPRSTVATTTELYDFLRVLFARLGRPHCPCCGEPLFRRTVDQIVDCVLSGSAEARVMVLAPLARAVRGDARGLFKRIQREGFIRARVNGALVEVADALERSPPAPEPREGRPVRGSGASGRGDGATDAREDSGALDVDVVVDRLVVQADARRRIADAVELALRLGDGTAIVSRANGRGAGACGGFEWVDSVFSERYACTTCGTTIGELSPRMFSFNSPYGACPACNGLGVVRRFDPELIVPDPDLSLAGGAVAPWAALSQRAAAECGRVIRELCAAFDAKPTTPFRSLPEALRRAILLGTGRRGAREAPPDAPGRDDAGGEPVAGAADGVEFEGVIPNLERRARSAGASARARLGAFQSERVCEACLGARLRAESRAVRVGGRAIHEITRLSIEDAAAFFEAWTPGGEEAAIAAPLLGELRRRLRFMMEVGLDYLTLDRASATLSGGEAQRIRLATQLGSGLVGVCYVLDEPTIGLHQRDNERLLRSIRRLVDLGNTVIVVEHDEDVIRAADHLIDIGPGAGLHGGRVVAQGPVERVLDEPASITGRYLRGEYRIQLPEQRRAPKRSDFLQVVGAREHNLQRIDVAIPLGVFCAVTGVSGSGKSTLVTRTLLPALRRRLYRSTEVPGAHDRLVGASKVDKVIEVDQSPIGRTPRSNAATYTGVFDEIRRLYARTQEARIRGYDHSRFSFNAKGGRCEACQGQGVRCIEMHFLPDVFVECAECRGTRYNRETLEVRYRGKSIADVLAMRVEEALPLFDSFARIRAGLQALADVGLAYLRLGQPSNTLSGGEAQRVKLAAELCKPSTGHTLYVLDEPTTGLHFADIDTLLSVLNRLVNMGNTVLAIEHNLDVIACADWVIDLGPEGGQAGGRLVVAGPPETIAACAESHTGRYLKAKLERR